ncbi:MAG TPA: methionyl-tRNA formyltransferase [Tepidisphaeraceae bacterium]|jgi:methionyl-tRNA formyltransferase|nr:methionyl-tRNA formyltransferase [Tepidisphaeraceae bacterium]
MSTGLRVIFAGSGEFGVPTLKALRAGGYEVVQVVSQPDRPAGRGRKLTPTPIAQYAMEENLPLIRTEKIADEVLPGADVMVVIAFGQKIPEALVNHARLGAINLHASLLPKYRGAAPIHHAIVRGETVTGNSVIRLAQRMDAGAVLGQSQVVIGETETTGELHDRLSADGPGVVMGVIERLQNGTAVERVQDESLATVAGKLSREDAVIDWSRGAREIARQINGLSPWPGCRVQLVDAGGGELMRGTLLRARAVAHDTYSRWAAGEVTMYGVIKAGDGLGVEVMELRPESKKGMTMEEYRRGKEWPAGARVRSIG